MTRRRLPNREELLTHKVSARFAEPDYRKLLTLMENTNTQSLGELVRRIITKDKILLYLKDSTLDGVYNQLAGIKTELNFIGRNINQITHALHLADTASQKTIHAMEAAIHYRKVGEKVTQLLALIADLKLHEQSVPSDKKLKAAFLLRDLVAAVTIT